MNINDWVLSMISAEVNLFSNIASGTNTKNFMPSDDRRKQMEKHKVNYRPDTYLNENDVWNVADKLKRKHQNIQEVDGILERAKVRQKRVSNYEGDYQKKWRERAQKLLDVQSMGEKKEDILTNYEDKREKERLELEIAAAKKELVKLEEIDSKKRKRELSNFRDKRVKREQAYEELPTDRTVVQQNERNDKLDSKVQSRVPNYGKSGLI